MEDTITDRDDVVAIDLPAPEGWKKKFTPKKGGTPRRNEIIFISPTGEEIRNKKQLDQYVKSHPGGPSASEFDWGTGDTPRRSSRLSEKTKATETPESETPKKMQKKSSLKKGAKKETATDGDDDTAEEKEEAAKETKESAEVDMEDADDDGDHDKGEMVAEEALADKDDDTEQATKENIDERNLEKPENKEEASETTAAGKEEDGENKSLPIPGLDENKKEAEKELVEPQAPSQLPVTAETASSKQEDKTVKDAVPEKAGWKAEEPPKHAGVGKEDHPDEGKPVENHSTNLKEAPHEPEARQVSN